MSLMADLNDMEKTISRLKDELTEVYQELDARLDGEKPEGEPNGARKPR